MSCVSGGDEWNIRTKRLIKDGPEDGPKDVLIDHRQEATTGC